MYRFLEILPGALVWVTLIGMVLVSVYMPAAAAIFIILFDTYWLLRTATLSLYLIFTFHKMKENLKIDWLEKTKEINGWDRVYHLVLLPMYKEPYELVKETFNSLLKGDYPKEKIIIVLGTEERAGEEALAVAKRIEQEYGGNFHSFLVTSHPFNLEGEIPGKGSNQAWMAKEVRREIVDKENLNYEDILVSVFDVDTQVYPEYFGRLTHAFLTTEDRQHTSYQPIPLFNNNIFEAPVFARVVSLSATFYQMMQQARAENLATFSSHSMPFKALVEIGFWHKNVVSEDSRIFWQCYLHYNSNWKVIPLAYPVSMDANVAAGFWQSMRNVYKQQRRWAWGSENIAYVITSFIKNKEIKLRKKLYWTFHKLDSFYSWATASILIFALGWLPLLLGGDEFNQSVLSYNLPQITQNVMGLAMLGILLSAILGVILLPPKPEWFKPHHYLLYLIQWILLPVTMILLGGLPAIDAQTRLMLGGRFRLGYWVTPKSR
ncbi:MAG: glycosyltransferase family 2 protein [Candidatus Colwellbacteria bacterium]|nr:glycosyltransferase family 2 protein [Candidatus Colwellbacteria bacterium]